MTVPGGEMGIGLATAVAIAYALAALAAGTWLTEQRDTA